MTENLEEKYKGLLTKVTQFSKVRQELVVAKQQIDQELERYEAISEFNKSALQLTSFREVITIALESIIEAFELEFCIYFSIKNNVLVPVESFGVQLEDIKTMTWNPEWIEDKEPRIIYENHLIDQSFTSINIHQGIFGPVFDGDGTLTGLVLSGITKEGSDFYENINQTIIHSYSVILQQIGALNHIFYVNENLEIKVIERTRELAEQKLIVEERNIELKETLDELARVKISRKSIAFSVVTLIVLVAITEVFFDPWIDEHTYNNYISLSIKMAIALMLKPVESIYERLLISRTLNKSQQQ